MKKVFFLLICIGQARIVQAPKDVAVLEGDDALFMCLGEGSPEPSINFVIDGQTGRLSSETGKVIPLPGGGGTLLRLFKVSFKQNGIKVECVVSNHIGNDKASAQLKVFKYTDSKNFNFSVDFRYPNRISQVCSYTDISSCGCWKTCPLGL